MSDGQMTTLENGLDQIELVMDAGRAIDDDVILTARTKLDAILEWAKDQDRRLKDLMTRHVQASGHDLVLGTVRYYVGVAKTTKDRSPRQTLEVLLQTVAGDLDRLSDALSANAWKHGAARKIFAEMLGDDAGEAKWAECFEVVEKTELKEGNPVRVKELQKTDTRFLK